MGALKGQLYSLCMSKHAKSSLFGVSLMIPITGGRLNLGTWHCDQTHRPQNKDSRVWWGIKTRHLTHKYAQEASQRIFVCQVFCVVSCL